MTTHVYRQIHAQGTKSLPCPGCGKKVRRSTTITNTVNPFNHNAEGMIKTPQEVNADVQRLLTEWKTKGEVCRTCSNAQRDLR